jgi:hypothetical protein
MLSPLALGQNVIGVSPGNIDFMNVLRGGYAERVLTISFDSEEEVSINLSARGEIAEWVNFPDDNLTVSKENPLRVTLSIEPPSDIPNGNYTGFVRVVSGAVGKDGAIGHAAGKIVAAIDIEMRVEITDNEILECSAKEFYIGSVERGEKILVKFFMNNRGNVRLRPTLIVDIWDQDQITIVKHLELRNVEVLPTRSSVLNFSIDSKEMDVGQYWAKMEVPDCFSSDILTFDVLEPGTLKAEGIILGIRNKPVAEEGETVPIIVTFKNVGEKEIDAQFRGKITYGDKIVQLLESEKAIVPIYSITNFSFYFTPEMEGKYIISGRVFYDKKRTFESSNVLNVIAKLLGWKIWFVRGLYLLIISSLIILAYKIRTERRRYLSRMRRAREWGS